MNQQRHKFTLGIDLGDRHCHLVIVAGVGGEEDIRVVERDIVETTPEAFAGWLEGREPMRVVIEVGGHARWIAEMLEARDHEVLVCNPRHLPEIYRNPKKSDFIDPETLARIGHTDASKLQVCVGFTSRDIVSTGLVRARGTVVEARAKLINHIRGAVKCLGARISGCEARRFHKFRGDLPAEFVDSLGPLFDVVEVMNEKIRDIERQIDAVLEDAYPRENAILRDIFGVGPITALYFIAIVGDPHRFESGEKFGSYLGLTQRRRQSGDSDPHLGVTKAGAPLLRALLVGAARDFMSKRAPDSALKDWAVRRTTGVTRVQKKRIVIGLARKLGVLMLHLLKTGQEFNPYPRGGAPNRDDELIMVREPV